MGRRRARRFFSALIALSALLLVTSCAIIPLFEIDIIEIVDSPLGTFGGATVTFSATFDNGDSYLWDFGDGSTGSGQVVVHTYSSEGTFTVRLEITTGSRTLVGTKEIVIRLGGAGAPTLLAGQLVLICVDSDGSTDDVDICTSNIDGTGFTTIIDDTNGLTPPNFGIDADFDDLININRVGQMVFNCTDPSDGSDICSINFDGSGFLVIANDTNGTSFPNYRKPRLNDAGQIVFDCVNGASDIDVCTGDFGATGFTTLVDAATCGTICEEPSINNAGQVAFGCRDGNIFDICGINIDGTGFRTIVDDTSTGNPIFRGPHINDSGQIALSCKIGSNIGEVCTAEFDQTGFNAIASTGITYIGNGVDVRIDINNLGQIVYLCSTNNICGINFAGFGQHTIAGIPSPLFDPKINDAGQVLIEGPGGDISAGQFGTNGFTTVLDSGSTGYGILLELDIN